MSKPLRRAPTRVIIDFPSRPTGLTIYRTLTRHAEAGTLALPVGLSWPGPHRRITRRMTAAEMLALHRFISTASPEWLDCAEMCSSADAPLIDPGP